MLTSTHRNDTICDWLPEGFFSHLLEVGEHHGRDLLRAVHLLSFTTGYLGYDL